MAAKPVKNTGNMIATIGGAVAIVAFLILPYVSLGIVSGSGFVVAIFGGFFVWLQLIMAIVVTILAAVAWSGSSRRGMRSGKGNAISLLVVALIGVLAMLLTLGSFGQGIQGHSLIGLLGIGYWLTLIGLAASAVGAVLQMLP